MTSANDFLKCRGHLSGYLTKSHASALTKAPGPASVGDANDNRRRWRNT